MEESGRDIIVYGKINDEKIKEMENILDSYAPNISLAVYDVGWLPDNLT